MSVRRGTLTVEQIVEAASVAIDEDDLVTPVDFEEAAEKSIDAKNYKTELTAIEADIDKP